MMTKNPNLTEGLITAENRVKKGPKTLRSLTNTRLISTISVDMIILKENFNNVLISFLIIPNMRVSMFALPKVLFSKDLREMVKLCLRKPSQAKPKQTLLPFQGRNFKKNTSGSVPRVSENFSNSPKKIFLVLSLSTKSTH